MQGLAAVGVPGGDRLVELDILRRWDRLGPIMASV
jgi:hypothetical protein